MKELVALHWAIIVFSSFLSIYNLCSLYAAIIYTSAFIDPDLKGLISYRAATRPLSYGQGRVAALVRYLYNSE